MTAAERVARIAELEAELLTVTCTVRVAAIKTELAALRDRAPAPAVKGPDGEPRE